MIQAYTLMGMLGWCSLEDLRNRKVLVNPILAFGIVGVCLHLYYRNLSIYSVLAGVFVGVILLLVGAITGKIGAGDGLVLLVSGIYLGFWDNARLLFHGLVFCGIWSAIQLLLRKKKRQDEIAFIPFLFLAYLEMMFL